ncbi:hypothetical protein D3C78_1149340 [compost metagenome]
MPAIASAGLALIIRKYIFNFKVLAKRFQLSTLPEKMISRPAGVEFDANVKSFCNALSISAIKPA